VVASVFVWFYGRWLLSPRVELAPFRWLQEGMALGDVALIALAVKLAEAPGASRGAAAAQALMAGGWLVVRTVFLLRTYVAPRRRPSAHAARFVPPSAEERFWVERLPSLFGRGRPGALAWLWQRVTVTPLAHVTFLNVDYQVYLNQIFHTTRVAKIGHGVCIPLNVMLLFYGLAQFTPAELHPTAHGARPFMLNAGLALLLLLAIWYVALAVRVKSPLLGLLMCGWLVCLWLTGNTLYSLAFTLEPAARHWWLPTPWYLAPLFWMGIVSGLQAWSHIAEPLVPPRANGTRRWLSVRSYILGEPGAPRRGLALLGRGIMVFVGSLWGTLDEWWASSKLLPFVTLEWLWRLGYRPDERARFEAHARRALASGDAALDFVGVGADASPRDV
jgi:hypothetical protein